MPTRLPRLISAGHLLAADDDTVQTSALLAATYTLATRMLIKLGDQQLGWMAADRAQVIATGSRDPLTSAEAARNLTTTKADQMATSGQIRWPPAGRSDGHQRAELMTATGQFLMSLDR